MANLVSYLPRAKALQNLSPEADNLLTDLLGQLLLIEGPPAFPLERVSEGFRTELVRTPKGKTICLAHTWTTGPWVCLLLETPTVPMGRPIFLANETSPKAPPRTITDSRSQTFQRKLRYACDTFDLKNARIAEGDLHTVFGSDRTFVAWRPREEDETFAAGLRYDVDNAAKNILDGLQAAGILVNDRGIRRLTAAKDLPQGWDTPPMDLESAIREEARTRRGRGDAYETILVDMRLSKAHLSRIFPEWKAPKTARVRHSPEDAQAAAQQALDLYRAGSPYQLARRQARASAQLLRPLMAQELRDTVTKALKTSAPQEVATSLKLDLRTLRGIFREDESLSKALLGKTPKPSGGRSKKLTMKALDRAVQDVLHNKIAPPDAATKHRVNLGSLRSKLARLNPFTKTGSTKEKKKPQPKAVNAKATKPKAVSPDLPPKTKALKKRTKLKAKPSPKSPN